MEGILAFYFSDFRRLRGEFDSLGHQEVAVLGAIHSLFVAGISPIRIDQVRALASSGFGAVLDPPIVSGALERLYSMSFVRERSPVVPEEAFLREVFEERAGRARLDEVEGVLHELQDAVGLSQLGNTHYYGADFERASRVMRLVANQFRVAGTPESLVLSHVWNQRVQRPRQGRLDNHSGVTLFQGYCDFTVD